MSKSSRKNIPGTSHRLHEPVPALLPPRPRVLSRPGSRAAEGDLPRAAVAVAAFRLEALLGEGLEQLRGARGRPLAGAILGRLEILEAAGPRRGDEGGRSRGPREVAGGPALQQGPRERALR